MVNATIQPTLWLNGRVTPSAEAHISPFDSGYLVGDGAFETLRAYRGVPFAVTRHWERLLASCEIIGMPPPEDGEFRAALEEVLAASNLTDARLRFTVSRSGQLDASKTILATSSPLPLHPPVANVWVMPWPRNEHSPLAGAKSLSYGENVIALRWAKQRGAHEGIFANTKGELCEGTASNLFVVHDGVLMTPPLSSGCLAGVTRALVLDLARAEGLVIEEVPLSASALSNADEAFITSSIREVQPISHVNGDYLSQSPGPLSRRLAELFRQFTLRSDDP